jgi:hypothetical protein
MKYLNKTFCLVLFLLESVWAQDDLDTLSRFFKKEVRVVFIYGHVTVVHVYITYHVTCTCM